jgi:hypothetical protein
MTITNTSGDEVWVHLVWVPEKTCSPNNLWIYLSGNDTFTFLDKALGFQNNTRGFLYAKAVMGIGNDEKYVKRDFNYLIGQELLFMDNPESQIEKKVVTFGVNAVPFQAINVPGTETGVAHLDGSEYVLAPKTVYFPRFFGQPDYKGPSSYFFSNVILVNLTGGMRFTTSANIAVYNDDERHLSEFTDLDCWALKPLNHLSDDTNATWDSYLKSISNADDEPYGFEDFVETGWISITGFEAWNKLNPQILTTEPSLYAVLVETLGHETFAAADLPWQIEDAMYNHATLWSTSQNGDL